MSDTGKNSKPTSPKREVVSPTPDVESNTQVDQQNELEIFMANVGDLTAQEKELLKELYIANGQDAYDAEAAAVGRLKQDEYLALPQGMVLPKVHPKDVGRSYVRQGFPARLLAAVYTMNKARAPAGENASLYGMIRLEAVKMGWVHNQKEIIYLPFDKYSEALKELSADLAVVRTQLSTLRLAAFLIPLACEHTFRVTGHHYLTGLATDYQARYRKTFKACLSEEVMTLLQPATMFHHVLHWVSPERAFNVLNAQLDQRTLPDALIIRANSAPAGWAIVTTTSAVVQAMESANIEDEVKEAFDADLTEVTDAARTIRADVRKWHKAYYAYGVAPPSLAEKTKMEEARDIAIAFAPYAQGFIEGTLKDAALGQAQALKKHAELNPVARQKSARFFRKLARSEVNQLGDLFAKQVKNAQEDDDE